ncbi:MAG: hypothetical protein ABI594_06475 [Ginsengibacter sp.]
MTKKKIFLASSSELEDDRKEFEIFINRKNKEWHDKGVFLELVIWEDFLDAMSKTRLQDKYNEAIAACDIFIMLFFTKVGKYTNEEFETAFGHFKKTNKPFIFTYFNSKENAVTFKKDNASLIKFKKRLEKLGHFCTTYKNIEELQLKFTNQLEKLVANGFIEFNHSIDIKEKNIVRKDIERVKNIHIGDKETINNENYNRKNIVEGNVRDADNFRLGDD